MAKPAGAPGIGRIGLDKPLCRFEQPIKIRIRMIGHHSKHVAAEASPLHRGRAQQPLRGRFELVKPRQRNVLDCANSSGFDFAGAICRVVQNLDGEERVALGLPCHPFDKLFIRCLTDNGAGDGPYVCGLHRTGLDTFDAVCRHPFGPAHRPRGAQYAKRGRSGLYHRPENFQTERVNPVQILHRNQASLVLTQSDQASSQGTEQGRLVKRNRLGARRLLFRNQGEQHLLISRFGGQDRGQTGLKRLGRHAVVPTAVPPQDLDQWGQRPGGRDWMASPDDKPTVTQSGREFTQDARLANARLADDQARGATPVVLRVPAHQLGKLRGATDKFPPVPADPFRRAGTI